MNIHEETLKIARNLMEKDPGLTDWVIGKFPELKESEDKSIIKSLIGHLKECRNNTRSEVMIGEYAKWIAWLEKQVKHTNFLSKIQVGDRVTRNEDGVLVNLSQLNRLAKPANKVEPKFHEGEWVTNGDYTWKIVKVESLDYILQSQDGNIVDDTISHVDKQFHSFTIEDAKDGDVLEFGDHGRLVVGIVSYVNKTTGKVDVNCLLENNNFKVGNYYNLDTIKPHPATKEQRDTLMKAMADAGYTFDFEKKELKKIEQKAAEWSKEDETRLTNIIIMLKEGASHHFIKDDITKAVDWLKSLRPQDRWKPTEKQMETLEYYMHTLLATEHKEVLFGLYNDLKQL